jgi:hypothetical protein
MLILLLSLLLTATLRLCVCSLLLAPAKGNCNGTPDPSLPLDRVYGERVPLSLTLLLHVLFLDRSTE